MSNPTTALIFTLSYLDPGTGSIILQAVLGAVLGAIFTLKLYWRHLWSLLTGRHKDGASIDDRDRGNEQ